MSVGAAGDDGEDGEDDNGSDEGVEGKGDGVLNQKNTFKLWIDFFTNKDSGDWVKLHLSGTCGRPQDRSRFKAGVWQGVPPGSRKAVAMHCGNVGALSNWNGKLWTLTMAQMVEDYNTNS